ncbi:hypothetical protein BCR34DRAFT_601194 [Clohesyomyces aquaticus]|uniref:Heterokaryon incompatibility domain-containing protein n=1 Tax=Clohesyomyces aquaticus TaxID=1231657 RepID=A0A1Y1ZMU3_9PLEO|nr:hypothetical protein BCR34DRAFT_601194 [Clohesyomyces aquaticus]
MRQMIRKCEATHDWCRVRDEDKQLPTPLIDLDGPENPRLIHTEKDDPNDWAKEAPIMRAIYESSFVIISAMTASDSTTGFLQRRRRRRFKPITVHHESVNPYLVRTMVLRPWLQSWTKSVEGEMSLLSSRGWVIQEWLILLRTLQFGHERTFWECRSDLVPEGDCYHEIDLTNDDLWKELGSEWQFNKHFLFPQEDFNYQPHLARTITRANQTLGRRLRAGTESLHKDVSDKFVAVSGITRRMHALLGDDTCIPGLWKGNLLQGLLWEGARNGKRNPEYSAPSWSWACMFTLASYPKDLDNPSDLWGFRTVNEALLAVANENPAPQEEEVHYASPEDDHALFSSWVRTVLSGVDISDGVFNMAFSNDSRAMCKVTEDGFLEFGREVEASPHRNDLFIGDAIRLSLDEPAPPEPFHRDSRWYIFELQHVVDRTFSCFGNTPKDMSGIAE